MSLGLDGTLTEEDMQALNNHLGLCWDCRERWQAMERAHHLFSAAESVVPSPALQKRIMAQIPARPSYTWFSRICIIGLVGLLILESLGFLPVARIVGAIYRDPTAMASYVRRFFDFVRAVGTALEAMGLVLRVSLSNPVDMVMFIGYLLFALLLAIGWNDLVSDTFRLYKKG
jgi:hypothetical protein